VIAFSSPHPCTLQRHPEGSRVACSPPPCRPPRGQRLREWTPREHCLRRCDTRLHSHGCRQAATILVLDCSMPANVTINGGPSRTHVQCYQCSDSGHREVLSGCVNNHCGAAKRSSSTVFLRLAPCWLGLPTKKLRHIRLEGATQGPTDRAPTARTLRRRRNGNVSGPAVARGPSSVTGGGYRRVSCAFVSVSRQRSSADRSLLMPEKGEETRSSRLVLSLWIREAASPGHRSFGSVVVSFLHNLATSDCV